LQYVEKLRIVVDGLVRSLSMLFNSVFAQIAVKMSRNIVEDRHVELIKKSIVWAQNCTGDADCCIGDNGRWEDEVNEFLHRSCMVQSSKLNHFMFIIVTDGI
jgi:hypothetical protein